MSILFGGIRQLGMVVPDVDAAMKAWARIGVGPFFPMRFVMDDFVYRGKPSASPIVTLAFAHSGPLQLELIQQHNAVPSAYTEFLQAGRVGAQHVAAWYADHASYDAKRQELLDRGFAIVHEAMARANGARFAYFETGEPGGLQFEISQALLPGVADMPRIMERAAQEWDGQNILGYWPPAGQ
jgi:catechol 2,3-dioxygenase-like lactoylglutathione lyase family enzyme